MKTINYKEQLKIAKKYDLSVYDLQIAQTVEDLIFDFKLDCKIGDSSFDFELDCSDAEFERICEVTAEADNKINSFTDEEIPIEDIAGAIVRLRRDGVEWKKIIANRFALVAQEVQ